MDLPSQMLDVVFKNLLLDELWDLRRVSKGWNLKIKPLLVQLSADPTFSLGQMRQFSSLVRNASCQGETAFLYFAKLNFINLESLHLQLGPDPLSRLSFCLLEFFARSSIKIAVSFQEKFWCNLNAISLCSLSQDLCLDVVGFLQQIDQPYLETLHLTFEIDAEAQMKEVSHLISQKFKALKCLELAVRIDEDMTLDVFPKINTLHSMSLDISTWIRVSCQLPLAPDSPIAILKLTPRSLEIARVSRLCLEGIKSIYLDSSLGWKPDLRKLFPNLLAIHLSHKFNGDLYSRPDHQISAVAGVQQLAISLEECANLILDFEERWPDILTCSLKSKFWPECEDLLKWILTCLPSLQTLILDIDESFDYDSKRLLQILNNISCQSLTKLYSKNELSLGFFHALLVVAPSLSFISSPVDQESSTFLSSLPDLYFEATPIHQSSFYNKF